MSHSSHKPALHSSGASRSGGGSIKSKHYNRGIIRFIAPKRSEGGPGKFLAEVNFQYKRYRRVLPTEAQARTWIDVTIIEIENQNKPLDPFETREARKAISLLPQNISLLEAVNFYISHQKTAFPPTPLSKAIDLFIEEKQFSGLRSRSVTELRVHLGRLSNILGNKILTEITGADIIDFLNGLLITGTTRNNYRRTFRSFFNWTQKIGYISLNPALVLTRARIDQRLPGILSVDQTQSLMHQSLNTPLAPFLALGFFAGIRPAELLRLSWDAITDHIHIGPEVAKVRRQRFVTIMPNLKIWLTKFRSQGRIVNMGDKQFWETLRNIRKQAGLTTWPSDAARHSFATYYLALFQDAPRTAHELGHSSTDMLYQHYRNLATHKDAQKYFKIIP